MTAGDILTTVGGALLLAGLITAGIGVRKTRKKYAPERPGAWRWVTKFWDPVRSLLSDRHRRRQVVVEADVASAAASAHDAGLAALQGTPQQREQLLMEEMALLKAQMSRLQESAAKSDREQREAVRELKETVHGVAEKFNLEIKSAMADGLPLQAVGLWLTAAGTVLTIVGAVI